MGQIRPMIRLKPEETKTFWISGLTNGAQERIIGGGDAISAAQKKLPLLRHLELKRVEKPRMTRGSVVWQTVEQNFYERIQLC